MTSESSSDGRSFLELIGPTLAMVTALLPAVGFATRWVAFSAVSPPIPPTIEIASSASLGQLTATGFDATFLPLVGFVLAYQGLRYLAPLAHLSSHGDERVEGIENLLTKQKELIEGLKRELADLESMPHPTSSRTRKQLSDPQRRRMIARLSADIDQRKQRLERARELGASIASMNEAADAQIEEFRPLAARADAIKASMSFLDNAALGRVFHYFSRSLYLVLAGFVIFGPWPGVAIAVSGTLIAIFYLRRRAEQRGQISFASIWPAAALVLLASIISSGLSGAIGDVGVATYTFRPPILVSGNYTMLGKDGERLFLRSCASKEVLAVNAADILRTRFLRRVRALNPQPNLIEVIRGHKLDLGLRELC